MKLAVVACNEPATLPTALFLALGVAAYAVSLTLFRRVLDNGPWAIRLAIGIIALPTMLIGSASRR